MDKNKMRVIYIDKCEECPYISEQINGYRCLWQGKLSQRNIINIHDLPDWCPLEIKMKTIPLNRLREGRDLLKNLHPQKGASHWRSMRNKLHKVLRRKT